MASVTVADMMLAYGGQNEALAAMKPTSFRAQGLRTAPVQEGQGLALPKGFRLRPLRPRRLDHVRRPADPDLPRRHRLFQGQRRHASGSSATRRASSRARAHGPRQRLRPDRAGRGHRLALRSPARQADRQRPRPQRDRQQLQRRRDPLGHLALGRGEHGRQGPGLRGRARLRLRGPGARDLDRRAGPDQGDGPLRPRGLPGRPEDGDRLHDRGQRRPGRRLLSLPAPAQGQAAPRRQAPDARDQGPAEVQHDHEPEGGREARVRLGRHQGPRSQRGRPATRRPSTCRAATMAPPSSWASRAASSRRAAATSRPRTAATPSRARSGSTRPTTRTSSAGRSSSIYESPRHQVLTGPDAITQSPRGGILVCEDGVERGRQRPDTCGART